MRRASRRADTVFGGAHAHCIVDILSTPERGLGALEETWRRRRKTQAACGRQPSWDCCRCGRASCARTASEYAI